MKKKEVRHKSEQNLRRWCVRSQFRVLMPSVPSDHALNV